MERYFKPFCIAPHPDVIGAWREEYEARMKELGDMPMVRIAEKPKPYGLDDEVIYPKAEIRGWVLTAPRPPIVSKVSGVVRIVVLLVDFEDNEASTDPEHYYDFLFSDGTYPTGSLRDYYTEVSHGKVLLYGDVFGWYRAPNPYSYYTNKQYGLGKYPNNVQRMVEDTVALASSEVDFSLYDSNRDNYVDALIVVHAGPGAEVFPPSGALNNIWSHKWVTSHTLDYNEVNMFAYLTVPEDGKLGVFAHELGHLLFRWPDLYDYVYPKSSGLGEWCVMASGSWNNGGDTPAHPSAWCKLQQGWVDPITIEDRGMIAIPRANDYQRVYKLWTDGKPKDEYFLLENRKKHGFDSSLPGEGLLIYHVDEDQTNNNDERRYKVGLMQADGKNDLARIGGNRGDDGDPFPGSSDNRCFDENSNPSTDDYDDYPTGVSVTDISDPGSIMYAQVDVRKRIVPTGPEVPTPTPEELEAGVEKLSLYEISEAVLHPSHRVVHLVTEVEGIGRLRASALAGIGIITLEDLASTSSEVVASALASSIETASGYIVQAKRLLGM